MSKYVVTRNSTELAKALGLGRAEAIEIEVHNTLNSKIVDVVERRGLTHAQVARLAGTSRTRITAVMNHNTADMSTDMLMRILASLGVATSVRFRRAA